MSDKSTEVIGDLQHHLLRAQPEALSTWLQYAIAYCRDTAAITLTHSQWISHFLAGHGGIKAACIGAAIINPGIMANLTSEERTQLLAVHDLLRQKFIKQHREDQFATIYATIKNKTRS